MKVFKNIATLMLLATAYGNMAAQTFTANGISYRIDGYEATVIRSEEGIYKGVVILPEKVHFDGMNYTVTAIDDKAFEHSLITDIQIPNTVITIGESAFAYCEDLTSITLPLNLIEISNNMLAGTSIGNIVIPEGVDYIGNGAFQSCHQLHSVFLPESIAEIDDNAFDDCVSLYEIYCASPIPPITKPINLKGIDLVLSDYDVIEAYEDDPVWGNTEAFTLYPNEDISLNMYIEQELFHNNFKRINLGNNLAYKIYDGDELIALTAADNYYFTIPTIGTNFAIVPTTMMGDADEVGVTIETTALAPARITEINFVPVIYSYDGTIYITGDNYGTWTRVYDIYGNLYYSRPSGAGGIFDLPRHRIYIVIVGDYAKKVFL